MFWLFWPFTGPQMKYDRANKRWLTSLDLINAERRETMEREMEKLREQRRAARKQTTGDKQC